MDNGTQSILTIERISQGGYIVTAGWRPGDASNTLIATTTIDEALKFISDKMRPIPPVQGLTGYNNCLKPGTTNHEWMTP